jgi:serine/threonine-protein kinase HipA
MGPRVDTATVSLWGIEVGAVTWDAKRDIAVFEYAPDFIRSGIETAPLTMPLSSQRFLFPELPRETFKGLPGLLADALPDKFGTALIDQWLVREGIEKKSFPPWIVFAMWAHEPWAH